MTIREYSYKHVPTIKRFSGDHTFLRALMGPFGSGKSSGCVIEVARRARLQEPDKDGIRRTRFAVVRNSYPQLKDTTIPTVMYWLEHMGDYKVSDFDFHLNRLTASDGSPVHCTIHFRALDKPQDIRNLLSLELTGCWFNEAREINERIINAMRGRVGRFPPKNADGTGGATWKGIWMDTNPPDTDHWFYRLFEEDIPHACLTCKYPNGSLVLYPSRFSGGGVIPLDQRKCPICGKDITNAFPLTKIFKQPSGFSKEAENLPWLPDDYYAILSAGMDQEFINVYCHGQYGYVKDGKPVYWNYDPDLHYSKLVLTAKPGYPLVMSFDNTGLNQACIICQYMPNGQFRILHEWLVENMGTRRLARDIVRPFVWSTYSGATVFITGDPAGVKRMDTDESTTFQEIIDAFGQGVTVQPARSNSWQARFNAVDNLLTKRIGKNEPALLISQSCKSLHRGFMGEYKMRRLQVVGKEKYVDRPEKNLIANVHDALQYAAMFTEDMYDLMSRNRYEPQLLTPIDSGWSGWSQGQKMVLIKSNAQLIQEEQEAAAKKVEAENVANGVNQQTVISDIAAYLRTRWDTARRAKITTVEPQMFANLRQAMGQYDNKKLAAIREIGGSEVFMGITDTKCRNAIAWIKDILFQPGGKPWGIEPTPVPELPPSTVEAINAEFIRSTMSKVMETASESDQPLDMMSIISTIQERIPLLQDEIKKMIRSKAASKAEDMEREIDDKLVEGGWYKALDKVIYDLVIINNGFIKGPIKRNRNVQKIVIDPATNREKMDVVKEIIDEYERRSPFDLYPEPDSNGIQDGYLFDHVSYRRSELAAFIGVEGFNEDEIRTVLKEFVTGGLREWTGIEADRAALEKKDSSAVYDSNKIDALEYYGPIPGSVLQKWGVVDIIDTDIDYETIAILIGNHVIKAVVNEDPLGRKPYDTASYEQEADSFWGKSLPQKIADAQTVCNACARALVNNVGMGSGPQVEINIDRLLGGLKGDTRLVPWKKWLTTNKMLQANPGPAINFWQPQMHAQEILTVYQAFSKIADEHSGIPAYAHGDPQVGGAGNTASGLSMLIVQASRTIKDVMGNIDNGLTVPSIERQFSKLLGDPKYIKMVGDIKLVAKGTSALIEKAEKARRMLELLAQTNNALDSQITGLSGRAYLLGETARIFEIDKDKFLAGMTKDQPGRSIPPTAMETTGTPPGTANLDVAGNIPSGAGSQTIRGQGGHPPVPSRA